ncbi:MAG TPA: VWA domain-containing protein, partial [Candidatus Polarisedimenticolia bacterium]|nr:VWA domain-containing protein [Candidatus Polarisedimenticolia bacterium]
MPGVPHAGPARPAAITILLAALALGGSLAAAEAEASSAPAATPSAEQSARSPCTIEIVAPKDGQVLYGLIDLVARAACPRDATIDEVTFVVDGRIAGRSARPPYRATWDSGGSFGAHLIEARLGDAQGRAARAVLMTPGAALTEAVRVSSTPLDLVELSVTVADESGRFVHGLTRDDFVVEEDGREKRIESVLPETRPLSAAVLVDVSDSTTDLWSPLRRAAPAFAGTLGPEDAAKVIAFSGSAYLVQEFTRDPGAIASSLERFRHWGGGTSLYDTLASAGVELAWGRGGRQAIVVLTDGIDTLSRIDAPRLRDYLRRTDVTIETFLLQPPGTTATPGYLRFKHDMETLSRETGGSLRVVADLDRIEEAFRDLGGELQNRTHLTYHSDRAGRA